MQRTTPQKGQLSVFHQLKLIAKVKLIVDGICDEEMQCLDSNVQPELHIVPSAFRIVFESYANVFCINIQI